MAYGWEQRPLPSRQISCRDRSFRLCLQWTEKHLVSMLSCRHRAWVKTESNYNRKRRRFLAKIMNMHEPGSLKKLEVSISLEWSWRTNFVKPIRNPDSFWSPLELQIHTESRNLLSHPAPAMSSFPGGVCSLAHWISSIFSSTDK